MIIKQLVYGRPDVNLVALVGVSRRAVNTDGLSYIKVGTTC